MPIPTRSRSLRQPGFSQTQYPGLHTGTPERGLNPPGNKAKILEQNDSLQNNTERDIRTAHVTVMGPPSQLKRASSLRKPLRRGGLASSGITHALTNASSADVARTQTVDRSLSRPQPVQKKPPPVIETQHTDQQEMKQSSAAQTAAKSHVSLHSRSQSVGGSMMLPGHQQEPIAAHTRDVAASSHSTLPVPKLRVSGRGQDISQCAQVVAGKPQFSTYKQHFTPRKTSRLSVPLIQGRHTDQQHGSTTISAASATDPGTGDQTPALQTQFSRLQDELLQLQLIHDSSHSQQNNHLQHTMRKLKAQFTALSQDSQALAAQEHAYHKESNCAAFQQWLNEGQLTGSEKTHTLARCIQDVTTLAAPDGKFCTAIAQFEKWFEGMIQISNGRTSAKAPLEHHEILVSPLEEDWHIVVAALHRKLDQCAQILGNLGPAKESSAIAMVLNAHKRFVDNLGQELEYCSAIERIVLEREQVWIANSVASIMQEDDPIALEGQQVNHRRGAWAFDMI